MPSTDSKNSAKRDAPQPKSTDDENAPPQDDKPTEVGGRGGLDPTRYGDWEKAGRCIDF